MPRKEQLFIYPAQLNSLSVLPFAHIRGIGKIRLGGNILEHPKRELWENRLNKYYYACACNTSAAGMIIAMLVGIGLTLYSVFQGFWEPRFAFLVDSLLLMGGITIGKLIGLLEAERELHKTIREIQESWKTEKVIE